MRKLILVAMLVGSMGFGASSLIGASPVAKAEPANSIKEVMKKAHKDGMLKKILAGEGDEADKKMLLDLYIDMLEGKPEKGDQAEWLMMAGKSVVAAGKLVVGREGALEELKVATNCKACHDVFK